ncbi:MAG TPA: PsbP-related protein [Candidatus Omnitrophota bacterium]|nr:PsbP-related protein [Candidatus Omnitrophota bacterium]
MQRRKQQIIMIVIIGVLGALLILFSVKVLWKQWGFKNYVNNAYGFSMKYPASWNYKENVDGAAVVFFAPPENALDIFAENVNVVVQNLSAKRMSLKQYTDIAIDQMKAVFGDNLEILQSEPMSLSGEFGYKFVFIGKGPQGNFKFWCSWTMKDKNAYQVTYAALFPQYDKYIGQVEGMVKSFRVRR